MEFADESDVKNVLSDTSYVQEDLTVPTQSHFLWFKASNRKSPKLKQSKSAKLEVENGTQLCREGEITDALRNCDNVSTDFPTATGVCIRYLQYVVEIL